MSIPKCSPRIGLGVALTVTTVILATITAIALAAIFAPPFFATALLGSAAIYIAIGSGAATLISGIFTLLVLHEEPKNRSPLLDPTDDTLDDAETIKKAPSSNPDETEINDRVEAYLNEVTKSVWPEKFGGANFAPNLKILETDVRNHPNKTAHKSEIQRCLNKMNLETDQFCHNAVDIYNELLSLVKTMGETMPPESENSTEEDTSPTRTDSDETSSEEPSTTDKPQDQIQAVVKKAQNYIITVRNQISNELAYDFNNLIDDIFGHSFINEKAFSHRLITLLEEMDTTAPFNPKKANEIYKNLFELYDALITEEETRADADADEANSSEDADSVEDVLTPTDTKAPIPPIGDQYLDSAITKRTTVSTKPKTIKEAFEVLSNLISTDPKFPQFKDRFDLEIAKLDLSKDPTTLQAEAILKNIDNIAVDMGLKKNLIKKCD